MAVVGAVLPEVVRVNGYSASYQNSPQCAGLQARSEGGYGPEGRSGGPVLLLDVLTEHREGSTADGAGEVGP